MNYLKVIWKHDDAGYPVLLYSELDDERWELRKVEIFKSGYMDYAGENGSSGRTMLGEEPVPALEDIAANSEFEPSIIDKEEFDAMWNAATARQKP